MANMYPKNISEYTPEDSERIVYQELKNQLPDDWDVFYSVPWVLDRKGKRIQSEADFIVCSPEDGFLCLEVKGGNSIRTEGGNWYLNDSTYGERKLNCSPYEQAEKSMYYFERVFSNMYNIRYSGIYGAGVIFPFYSIPKDLNIDHRQRTCTIDAFELNNVKESIKKMFKLWGGYTYGFRVYGIQQHKALVELIQDRIAISAAAGALVKYKEQQLQVINRVQDNYIYFIKNVDRFYIKGGAGTGKTWIAKKMAEYSAQNKENKVAFLCSSKKLAKKVKEDINSNVEVMTMQEVLKNISSDFYKYKEPMYDGISESIYFYPKYDAIYIDEAQDFNQEWATIVNNMLLNKSSRLGIFYDDVQILRENSFGDVFDVPGEPYLLRENIRNTSNIYKWTSTKTNLGTEVIANPIEGPTPITNIIYDKHQLTQKLECIFKKFIEDEHLNNSSLVIIVDKKTEFLTEYVSGIAKWRFIDCEPQEESEIRVESVEDFKGLESDMVIYVHDENTTKNTDYIAYTRAKYYLIELIRR